MDTCLVCSLLLAENTVFHNNSFFLKKSEFLISSSNRNSAILCPQNVKFPSRSERTGPCTCPTCFFPFVIQQPDKQLQLPIPMANCTNTAGTTLPLPPPPASAQGLYGQLQAELDKIPRVDYLPGPWRLCDGTQCPEGPRCSRRTHGCLPWYGGGPTTAAFTCEEGPRCKFAHRNDQVEKPDGYIPYRSRSLVGKKAYLLPWAEGERPGPIVELVRQR